MRPRETTMTEDEARRLAFEDAQAIHEGANQWLVEQLATAITNAFARGVEAGAEREKARRRARP